MDYSEALVAMKDGSRVSRAGWNGKGMWLAMVEPNEYAVSFAGGPVPRQLMIGKAFTDWDVSFELLPWIGMKTADGKFVPWLCSQTDAMAEDWGVLS